MHNKATTDSSISVACTLIPIQGYNLLLPNQCIAEILIRSEIKNASSLHSWCIGEVNWFEEMLPIVLFERLETPTKLTPGKKNIIVAVQFPINNSEDIRFGIVANHTPQVIRANNQTMDREINPKKTHDYALSYISINGKSALIPDLHRIATLLQKHSRKTA